MYASDSLVFFPPPLSQALPNQQVVDYPSFKLVIVGDGGTGEFLRPFFFAFHEFFLLLDPGYWEMWPLMRAPGLREI